MPRKKIISADLANKPFDLSDRYWDGLTPQGRELYRLIRPMPKAAYTVDQHLSTLETFLTSTMKEVTSEGGRFELEPDFQRGHVWTKEQGSRYMESFLRGSAPRLVLFNCPGYARGGGAAGDVGSSTFQCIDGLQRLTAIRRFMAGELTVFGGISVSQLVDTPFDPRRFTIQLAIYEFTDRAELLQFYLDLNGGGVVHTQAELDRVRKLKEEAIAA